MTTYAFPLAIELELFRTLIWSLNLQKMSARLRPEWSKTLENSPDGLTALVTSAALTDRVGSGDGSDRVGSGQVTGRTSGRTLKNGRGRRPAGDGEAPDGSLRVDGTWVHSLTSNGA
ncbi:hypothetical protein LWI28_016165 [Acer negundo]|uniref:Uncharacterized protein n=1 Tax=Acer negundo TaxID=4023 RepID=A0AAD5JUV5_ACENE|nr:hypothetical protein LWI28_016165 [Acer negundo]